MKYLYRRSDTYQKTGECPCCGSDAFQHIMGEHFCEWCPWTSFPT